MVTSEEKDQHADGLIAYSQIFLPSLFNLITHRHHTSPICIKKPFASFVWTESAGVGGMVSFGPGYSLSSLNAYVAIPPAVSVYPTIWSLEHHLAWDVALIICRPRLRSISHHGLLTGEPWYSLIAVFFTYVTLPVSYGLTTHH